MTAALHRFAPPPEGGRRQCPGKAAGTASKAGVDLARDAVCQTQLNYSVFHSYLRPPGKRHSHFLLEDA